MTTAAPPSPAHGLIPTKPAPRWLVAVATLVCLWLVVGGLTLLLLSQQVPLTAQDMASASWLGHPGPVFFTSPLMAAVAGTWAAFGLFAACQRPPMGAVALALALLVYVGTMPESFARIGILDGTVRIGCFVPETAQCRAMLKLPVGDTRSMYVENTIRFAPWYEARLREVASERQRELSVLTSIPGNAIFRAPLYLASGERLKQLVAVQRQELSRLRANTA